MLSRYYVFVWKSGAPKSHGLWSFCMCKGKVSRGQSSIFRQGEISKLLSLANVISLHTIPSIGWIVRPGLSWDLPGVPPPDFSIESDEPDAQGLGDSVPVRAPRGATGGYKNEIKRIMIS
jgi:hypothetical protein